MEKTKRKAKILLCVSIALMLISMIVVSVVQTSGGHVTIKQLTIETDDGWTMDCNLYIPDTATEDNPAPGIVTSHGNYNNKEMQDANFVELSRRGYVVLAIDQPNHGDSESLEGSDFATIFCGEYQGALALSRLPYVDITKIGITGHSAGGRSCNFAVAQDDAEGTHIISAVLLNCADAVYTGDDGSFTSDYYGDRDVGMISAEYDEFFHYDYGSDGSDTPVHFAPYFMNTANAQSFLYFGQDPTGLAAREANTIYKESVDGKDVIRVIYRYNIIHPWSHFSTQATSGVIDFFDSVFGAPNSVSADNQIWPIKEAFNAVGLVGFALFVVSFASLMVYTPYFACLRAEEPVVPMVVTDRKGKTWFWLLLCASAIFSTAIYLPTIAKANTANVLQPESFAVAVWSALCGLFALLCMYLYYRFFGKKHGLDLVDRGVKMPLKKLGKTILLAVIVASLAYTWVFFANYFFKSDFRLWTLAIKTFDADKIYISLWPYLWLFLLFYIPASISANSFNYNTIGGKKGLGNAILVSIFTALPAIILPAMQYSYYFSTGSMLFWGATSRLQMFTLWLFPIILILMAATLISRAIYKVTKNPYLAGIISGIVVTLISCTNTRNFIL